MKLVIGNKNYSSWSLRPWLLLKAHGLDFEEVNESLNLDNITQRLGKYSDSCKVPVLIDEEITVWDSLAICEYVSERYLSARGWPESVEKRVIARSISSEMHSGFNALRSEMPMNCRLSKKLDLTEAVERDIKRIEAIWSNYSTQDTNGDMRLLGEFNIADCFFAPVVLRFQTYGVSLSGIAAEYHSSMLEHPSVQEWMRDAKQETEVLPHDEV